MCGIVGWVADRPEASAMPAALAGIAHRGPDSDGHVVLAAGGKHVHLGHTRLAILDLSPAGAQPMVSADGRWWVSFNGELYNHQLLRDPAHPWRSTSDTETLVELLASRGLDATLEAIDGMFAFAALDLERGELHVARDRFGIKPVYFTAEGPLAFASEIRSLRALGRAGDAVDADELQAFLALRYVPAPGTIWRGVHRLPAGHVISVDLASGRRRMRWFDSATTERFAGSFDEAVAQWRDVLFGAVQRQLLSDVPVGVLLSGGIDSAVVAAMAREATGKPFPTFTVGFGDGSAACELDDAAETAAMLDLPHRRIEVDADALIDDFDAIVRAVEEPLGTTSSLAYWQLTRRAREEVTVALTGQGADEPLGGYPRYQFELQYGRLRGRRLLAPLARGARPLLGAGSSGRERSVWALGERRAERRMVAAGALFLPAELRRLTGRADAGPAEGRLAAWLERLGVADSAVERAMAVDTRAQLADDLLLYGDKVSMDCALEVRVPILDLEAVRFLESLPQGYKLRFREGKRVHKAMAEAYLPSRIVHRPKRGFKVPYDEWVRGRWKQAMADRLLGSDSPLRDHLDAAAVEALWRDHQAGRRDATREIFALASLSVLLRERAPASG
ncbi:MAG: asparagine synthase (glutamine-hydrolyzing) [Deltaproteobacteria bacterium]|nr:MAG: asparagine synthase (glutamine-hydrolyzing) [Deltaproteobacteria bacterium]